eukprot:CAMPEP_0115869974 /NCGR_PEP_ID=MMETSP0287-20121206/22082_1 /TAXON_ID=412157 /ORGANISM="Chrysochromulina rotalis, Strain UIO044" /LENGTH=700 /DNA_ID=CAMNT_0003324671 /DNA_START=45 /DNA_END=2147 /DNA_ORIENTATION=+
MKIDTRSTTSNELLQNSFGSRLTRFVENPATPPGNLILVRHGTSEAWDLSPRTFVGWSDPDLSQVGEQQAIEAARAIKEAGYTFDVAYTSMLKRAVRMTWLVLMELECIHLACWKTWRLNERCYGDLTNQPLDEVQAKFGAETVSSWRRALDSRPPPFDPSHPHNPNGDPRYERWYDRRGVQRSVAIPNGESMQDTIARCLPVWKQEILPDLRRGKSVLVIAHANSIRALLYTIDELSDDELRDLEIPVGIPLVYRFERESALDGLTRGPSSWLSRLGLRRHGRGRSWHDELGNLVPITTDESAAPLSGEFLAKPTVLAEAQRSVRAASLRRYGIGEGMVGGAEAKVMSATEQATTDAATATVDALDQSPSPTGLPTPPQGATDTHMLSGGSGGSGGVWVRPRGPPKKKQQQHVVIIRHGKTGHNKLGLFTGWEDVALAEQGRQEAIKAGKQLRAHGIEFDVVYTSWLQRAIETAWLVLVELDAMWLPIHKSWRLNERMYGGLTGLSKKMTRTQYGEDQFKKWRRSYDTKPPPVSSFSQHYPGNDQRYVDNVLDVRISVKESLIRSLERGRITIHRKLPRTESLKDCMDRTIPYFVNNIEGNAIAKGKSVLIASSENAIRGLLMHLLDIPTDRIVDIEIPTGLPLIYDLRYKCLRLLEGDFYDYNFGKAAELLFTPCEIPDDEYDELDLSPMQEQDAWLY